MQAVSVKRRRKPVAWQRGSKLVRRTLCPVRQSRSKCKRITRDRVVKCLALCRHSFEGSQVLRGPTTGSRHPCAWCKAPIPQTLLIAKFVTWTPQDNEWCNLYGTFPQLLSLSFITFCCFFFNFIITSKHKTRIQNKQVLPNALKIR